MELQEGEDKLRSSIVRVSDLIFFCLYYFTLAIFMSSYCYL